MNQRRKRRLLFVLALLLGSSVATALTLYALRENLLYFYTPAQVVGGGVASGVPFNLGGMVTQGSVAYSTSGASVSFQLHDGQGEVTVAYTGLLPDLFREGQGIVATGALRDDGVFVADIVLAKHDENYMPQGLIDSDKPLSFSP